MPTRGFEEETSRRGFLRRLADTVWGGVLTLTSFSLLTSRPRRAWAEEATGTPSASPMEPPKPEVTGQPLPEGTGQPFPEGTGQPPIGEAGQARVVAVSEEEFNREFEFVDMVQSPRSMTRSSSGCSVSECCSSGDIWVCERGNNGSCGESNFCQEQNTGDCDRINGCRYWNSGGCGGNTNICATGNDNI